ncbi:MAG: AAA family ATPase, partial [Sphingomonas sp.]
GGVGASSVATSLAWLTSTKISRTTALLDLDVHFGTGALALDLEPGRGLTDAIENPSRIDGLFIERAMVKANDKLAILSAEAPINAPILSDGSAFYQLQDEMRSAFECTITDLPRLMLVQHPHLMADVNATVIVTELTLASARDTIRLLSWMKSNAPQSDIVILANKVHNSPQLEISRKDFESSIERKVDYVVPFDQKLAAQAAKLGKSFAEAGKGSKTGQPLYLMAQQLIDALDGAANSDEPGKAKSAKGKEPGQSLLGKFADLKSIMPKVGKKK